MKKPLLTILIALVCLTVSAQTKHLPAKIHLELSDKEYQEFYKKIDSLVYLTSNTSNAPATFVNPFLTRFQIVWFNIDRKVALQMVADTTKK